MGFHVPKTGHGHDPYEAISALQKAIRRGHEEDAMYFALQLIDVAKAIMLKRLRVIAMEDIGLADPPMVQHALSAIDLVDKWHQKNGGSGWRVALSNAILALARAKKSRVADNFQRYVRGYMDVNPIEIPDYALDKHTRRGKQKGRGFQHFVDVSTKLENKGDVHDPYQKTAERYWIAEDKNKVVDDAAISEASEHLQNDLGL